MGKSTINCHFQVRKLLVYQRLYDFEVLNWGTSRDSGNLQASITEMLGQRTALLWVPSPQLWLQTWDPFRFLFWVNGNLEIPKGKPNMADNGRSGYIPFLNQIYDNAKNKKIAANARFARCESRISFDMLKSLRKVYSFYFPEQQTLKP